MTDDVQVPGYKLIRKLGEGGMATVYLALQESLDREVALKIMSPVLAANETFCQQFMKEGRIAAKLSHPHLMTVHDIGNENGIYYLASEYLPAGTLRERMDRITPAETLEIARDIALGLSYAHEKGFVHRDVKPGNIMFRANGTAVLADFGIAKAMKSVSAATMAGNAIGTPDYMSPEQAQASPVDGRSDLYSLGAVVYECLAGHKPYQANDAYAVALMHVTEPIPQLPEKVAWLQPLIDGLMAKKPEQRFADGDAFIAACDRLVQSNPQVAASMREQRSGRRRAVGATASTSVSQPGVRVALARKPVIWIGGTAAAVVLVGGISWYLVHHGAAPDHGGGIAQTAVSTEPDITPPMPPPPTPDAAAQAKLAALDVPTLLGRAEKYLADAPGSGGAKLSFPPGDNAIDMFREVLRRDPSNKRASQGLDSIATFFEQGAQKAYQNGLYTGADVLVEAGLRADPKNAGLLKLRAAVDKAQKGG